LEELYIQRLLAVRSILPKIEHNTPPTNAAVHFSCSGKNSILLIVFLHFTVTSFRSWIKDDSSGEYPAAANRYHLYVASVCRQVNTELYFVKNKFFVQIFAFLCT
jgi:hypothetical protein